MAMLLRRPVGRIVTPGADRRRHDVARDQAGYEYATARRGVARDAVRWPGRTACASAVIESFPAIQFRTARQPLLVGSLELVRHEDQRSPALAAIESRDPYPPILVSALGRPHLLGLFLGLEGLKTRRGLLRMLLAPSLLSLAAR